MNAHEKLSRRGFLCGAAAGMALAASRRAAAESRPPNFVIILADDLGYGDLGCYGGTAATPHLDRLAASGVRFTDFHSNAVVCSPTRTALLTGRYPQRFGIEQVFNPDRHREKPGLPLESVTFAEMLRAAGYTTGLMGKWHLGYPPAFNPLHHGFDVFHGFLSGNVDYRSHVDGSGAHDWWDGLGRAREEGYTTDLITAHALRFLEENAALPFCLYVAHAAPHFPYQGPGDAAFRSEGKANPGEGVRTDKAAAYREMLESLDAGVGRVLDALERLGIAQQTCVFFCSDNGAKPPGSNGRCAGQKAELLEGGHRVPCIVRWTDRIRPGETAQTALTMDVFPTLAEAAGIALAPDFSLDGTSLLPLLEGRAGLPERTLFWRTGGTRVEKAVRKGCWKLRIADDAKTLHRLDTDLEERHDCAGQQPGLVEELDRALADWEAQFDGVERLA